jgi:hypothetical protein
MVDYLARPVAHEAFFKKYASKKFLKGKLVSLTPDLQPLDKPTNGLRSFNSHPPMGQEIHSLLCIHARGDRGG